MPPGISAFFRRHPLVRDAILWALPAILLGLALRLCLLSYQPYAYWGSDSRSYYSFAHLLFSRGDISLDEKRRYLYPILMVPVTALPGSPLKWLAWIQHTLGLLTIIPLAYTLRKSLVGWRWWVVPVTVAYSAMPLILWYEQELLGETIFFDLLVWAIAGWAAFASEPQRERASRLFWCFFVPFTLFILTKPSGRFYWPGVALGLVLVMAWRRLNWRHAVAIVALIAVTLTVGSKKQAAWLLYTAVFPLTQLDTPPHAEYKAELRDFVLKEQATFDTYYEHDDFAFGYLEKPSADPSRPLMAALDQDQKKRSALYFDLALEGIRAEPKRFLELGLQKLVASMNPSEFKENRFENERYPERFEHLYDASRERKDGLAQLILGLPRAEPLPDYAIIAAELAPVQDGFGERLLKRWIAGYMAVSDLVVMPSDGRPILPPRPTLLGWWMIAGFLLSLLPRYRPVLGVWALAGVAYLMGTFCVSQVNPRYFAPAWPALVPLLAVPADFIYALIFRRHAAVKK